MKMRRLKLKREFKISPFVLILGVLALPVFFFLYSKLAVSAIELEAVSLSDRVKVSETFDIKVDIRNGSKNTLHGVELTTRIPDSAALVNGDGSKITRMSLGDIGPGGSNEEIFKAVALPGKGSDGKFLFSVKYSQGSVTSIFEKTQAVTVNIGEVPLALELDYPKEVLSNEEFELSIGYKYSGEDSLHDLKIELDYPSVFSKTSSFPVVAQNEKEWAVNEIRRGDEGKISLKGRINLPDNSTFNMKARVLARILGKDYPIATSEAVIGIIPSPLAFSIYLNEDPKASYKPGDTLNYTLIYKNNTDIPLENASVKAKLTGQMYDFPSLTASNANFDQLTKTISWNSSTLDGLRQISPASTGSIAFTIKLQGKYPIRRLNDKNFTIKVDASIESSTVPQSASAIKTSNLATLENKIAGMITLSPEVLFRDAESLILNTGSLPPRVGQATDFTVHWKLVNFSTDVRNFEARAKLEEGVIFTNVVKGNGTEMPSFDKASNEVIWKINRIFATTGVTGESPEVIFQVRATPKDEHFGNYMPLVKEVKITALDEFTGLDMSAVSPAIDTILAEDTTVKEGEGKVTR